MFWSGIERFSENLKVLREFVNLISPFLLEMRKKFLEGNALNFGPFILALSKLGVEQLNITAEIEEKIMSIFEGGIDIKISGNSVTSIKTAELQVSGRRKRDFEQTIKELGKGVQHDRLLFNSSLISLISFTEWFLSEILHNYFEDHIGSAGILDKSLTYKEIKDMGSLEDARRYLIDLKVEEILRGSFEDWLNFFKEKPKLSFSYIEPDRELLIEVFQRRNTLIHNGGIINSIYTSKVPQKLREGLSIGDSITISHEYLERAINIFEKCFILLAAELWKKLDPNDDKRSKLINLAYDHIIADRFDVAKSLSYFIVNDKNLSEQHRLTAQINYWQCLKWQNRFNEVRSEVENADFSAKDEKYLLAQYALLDDNVAFYKLLPIMLKTNKISYEDLSTWPLFKEMRKDDLYAQYELEKQTINAELDNKLLS